MMLLLPVLYLLIIAGVGFLIYLHAVYSTELFAPTGRGRSSFVMLLLYVGPILAGAILVLFMVKPLFARRGGAARDVSLSRAREPLLFEFVERVCAAVGAPAPARIDIDCQVNASAGLRRGLWSMAHCDMVLTIGLPLVAGLDIRQFAGALAHEFGHFAQSAGMRLSYVVRSINLWFARLVYERDAWDEALVRWSQQWDWRLAAVLWVAIGAIWLTRRILWCLMMLGHMVSSFLMRQMEYDADLHLARLAGSDAVESTCRRLAMLNVAQSAAFADLDHFYREGRLADDLPRLIMENVRRISPEVCQKINEAIDAAKTGPFDTHPSDPQRIAAARRENAPGIFVGQGPATVLFTDFTGLSINTTADYYRDVFGANFERSRVHPLATLMEQAGQQSDDAEALVRFLQGAFCAMRQLRPPTYWIAAPANVRQAIARLHKAREQIVSTHEAYQKAAERFVELDASCLEAEQAMALLRAEIKVRANDFSKPLTSREAADKQRTQAVVLQQRLTSVLEPFEDAAGERIVRALELLQTDDIAARVGAEAAQVRGEAARVFAALSVINRQITALLQFRTEHAVLGALCSKLNDQRVSQLLHGAIGTRMENSHAQLADLFAAMQAAAYPFDHADGPISLAQYMIGAMPAKNDLGGLYQAGVNLLQSAPALYVRLVARLAAVAENVEAAIDLPKLPLPAKPQCDTG
jgi:Zn-dependent protease with chaperone function